jgi:hypothetical protein
VKFILVFLSLNCMAAGIIDLGNLDIKGNLNLPKYKLETRLLNLDSSLQKIARLEYEAISPTKTKVELSSSREGAQLLNQSDFVFDIKAKKVRLD